MAGLTASTRIELICPSGSASLLRATNAILVLLLAEPTIRGWGGLTYSSLSPAVFTGMFWDSPDGSTEHGEWESDNNILIRLDAPGLSSQSVLPYLDALRDRVQEAYIHEGNAQKALWITVHPLEIVM